MDSEEEGSTKRWNELLVDFTQETTLHGIRYITGESRYLARRLTWVLALLTAAAVFIYFATTKLTFYYKFEKNVKVEVIYPPGELDFPSVTICNLNQFHMRRLLKYGLIDSMEVLNSDTFTQEDRQMMILVVENEHYYFYNATCLIPASTHWKANFKGTRKMCGYLCSTLYKQKCASFLYTHDTCVLSSYTGNDSQQCEPNGKEEFYVRERSYVPDERLTCSFEWTDEDSYDTCEFEVDEPSTDEWSTVQALNKELDDDVTLESGYGHYLLLPQTLRGLGHAVSYTSKFIRGDGACLSFYYRFLGMDVSLKVFLRTPDLDEHLFVEVLGNERNLSGETRTDFGGIHFLEELPNGEFQVKIQAKRSESESSGIAIDNLRVWPCKDIDGSCRYAKTGRDYTGDISVTASGKPCQSWANISELHHFSHFHFPDRSIYHAKNYCRNPYSSGMSQPFCYFVTEVGILSKEECNIPYCDCPENDMFNCRSGFCIPNNLKCNGINDCGDNSDEDDPCEEFKSVKCDFEDEYMCGYYSDNRYPLKWARHRHDLAAIYGSPEEDGDSVSIGYYLFVDSRLATDGDRAVVYSPAMTLKRHTCVKLAVHVNISDSGDLSELSGYITSLDQRPLVKIFERKQSVNETGELWMDVKLPCVWTPHGEYRLMFQGTLGSKFQTKLGLDNVVVETDIETCHKCETIIYDPSEQNTFNCSMKGSADCDLSLSTSNSNLQWVRIPYNYIMEAAANFISTDIDLSLNQNCHFEEQRTRCVFSLYKTEDVLRSPNYPSNYPENLDLQFRIVTGTNATHENSADVTLQFLFMEIEDNECQYDYLQVSTIKGTVISKNDKICGSKDEHTVTTQADILLIDFHSDNFLQKRGFVISYRVEPSSDIDYAYALTNRIQSYGEDYSEGHFAGLATGEMVLHKDQCLIFDYYVLGTLTVNKRVGKENEIIWKMNTNDVTKGLIQVNLWQTGYVDLPTSNTPMVLSFDILFDMSKNNEGYAAFLKGISIIDGQCPKKAEFDCDFEEDSCGYKDMTTFRAKSNWIRVLHSTLPELVERDIKNPDGIILGDFLLLASMKEDPCILKSPMVDIQEAKCLSFNYFCGFYEWTEVIVEIIDESGKKFSNILHFDECYMEDRTGNTTWDTKYMNLPEGQFIVQFFLYTSMFNYLCIDNIHIVAGICSSANVQTYNKSEIPDLSPMWSSDNEITTDPSVSYVKHEVAVSQPDMTELVELGDLAVMTKSYDDLSLAKLLEDVSHNKEDLILDCKWNNEPCHESDFIPVHTELGVCYSFNYDKNEKQRLTSQTGAGSGLQLLLNIEEYEHLPGRATNAGIKVFLHTKDEIPYVKYLGAAVPPGMHSLIQIHPSKSKRLGQPYGQCSEGSSHWYPGEKYSHFKCQQGCHAKNVVSSCSCKTTYMPGDAPVCSISDFIQCAYPEGLKEDSHAGCECLQACNSYQYDTQVSYSRLSRLNVNLLLDKDKDNITVNYNSALENSRVLDRDALTEILSQINSLIIIYQSYYEIVKKRVFDEFNSILLLVREAVKKMLTLAREEIKCEVFGNFSIMVLDYHSKTLSFWEAIKDSLQQLRETLRSYHSVLQSLDMDSFNTSTAWTMFIETKLKEEIPHVMNTLRMYTAHEDLLAPLKATYTYLPFTYIRNQRKLEKCMDDAEMFLDDLNHILNNITIYEISDEGLDWSVLSKEDFKVFKESLLRWDRQSLDVLAPCFTEYETYLSLTQLWLDTITIQSTTLLDTSPLNGDQWLEDLSIDRNELMQINADFLARVITQVQLHEKLVTNKLLEKVYTTVNSVNNYLETDVFTPQLTELSTSKERLTSWYQETMNQSIIVGLYLSKNSSTLEAKVKDLHLWKKPYLDLDSTELIMYQYKDGQIDKSWPKGKSLEEFYLSTSDFVIHTRVEAVLGAMSETVQDVQTQLSALVTSSKSRTEKLTTLLNAFVEETEIDGEFVMNNFVDLNVFYGELKHTYVEEEPAYDIPSFFSELGGYLGLLLGASVITVCELLDMILYNTFLKYKLKQVQRKGKIEDCSKET